MSVLILLLILSSDSLRRVLVEIPVFFLSGHLQKLFGVVVFGGMG